MHDEPQVVTDEDVLDGVATLLGGFGRGQRRAQLGSGTGPRLARSSPRISWSSSGRSFADRTHEAMRRSSAASAAAGRRPSHRPAQQALELARDAVGARAAISRRRLVRARERPVTRPSLIRASARTRAR
jgi:hypothetical protein